MVIPGVYFFMSHHSGWDYQKSYVCNNNRMRAIKTTCDELLGSLVLIQAHYLLTLQ